VIFTTITLHYGFTPDQILRLTLAQFIVYYRRICDDAEDSSDGATLNGVPMSQAGIEALAAEKRKQLKEQRDGIQAA